MLWKYLISWIKTGTPEWEQRAREFQTAIYLMLEGGQWEAYEKNEYHLLDTRIYLSLYGLSNYRSEWRSNGSELDYIVNQYQHNVTNKIRNTIVHVYKRYSHVSTLRIGIILLYCKDTYKEFLLPIFRVHTSDKDDECFYVDTHCRIYDSWLSWKNYNKLPKLKYCYPLNGFYTCSNDHAYIFDSKREPILEFGSSPACKSVARFGRMLDVGSGIARYSNEFVGFISLFTSLDSIKIMYAGVVGVAGAVYGAARSVQRLVDKNRHEKSLLDAESLMHGLNILMIPLHAIMAAVNIPLIIRYRSQVISPRHILTTSAQKIHSFTFFQRLCVIVLTVVLHQKISAYLKTTHLNTNKHIDTIKPFNLRSLIYKRQSMDMPNMVDAETRKTSKKIISKNSKSVVHGVRTGITEKSLKKFESKSRKVLARLNVADKDLIQAAMVVTSYLGYNSSLIGAVVTLIEVERAGKSELEYHTFLLELQTVSDITAQFVAKIKKDCKEAQRINKNSNLKFKNNYTAVYHYRKHGAEFGSNTSMKVYLCDIPKELFRDKYLYSNEYDENIKLTVKTYTNINGFQYGVMKQVKNKAPRIATIYKNEKFFKNWKIKWAEAREKLQLPIE